MTVKIWIYLAIAAAVAAVVGFTGHTIHGWKRDAAKVPVLELQLLAKDAAIEQIRQEVENANQASAGYQAELERLRRARRSDPVVRVCVEPPSTGVPVSAPEPGSDAGTAPGGVLPSVPGPDIGPALYGAADRCDELSAQIRGLHDHARRQAGGSHAKKDGT